MKIIKPKLLVIAGPNGSGKTSITTQILKHEWIQGCIYINPDNIAQEQFGDWNSPEAVLKAANLAAQQREECLLLKQSLIFETVLSAIDKVEYMLRAKEAGFFIRLFFVGTNHPSINASRIAHRVMEGGHDVPITKIVSRFSKSIVNCCLASSFVDRLYVYDNSIEYADATLLFRASNGLLQKTYAPINEWALPIYESINPPQKQE
ncbi:MAG TPA: zeta toxin family protein [Chitinophagales bacterium]|nr:zeta toxin family protein [Chitinophagales bacterium]HRK26235.1 zeta toxin family protein [Chitinophagales bacterium]